MLRWVPYSLVRITIFFVSGVLLAIYQQDFLSLEKSIFTSVILCFIYLTLWLFIRKGHFLKFNVVLSGVAFLTIASFGHLHLKLSTESNDDDHIINSDQFDAFQATVLEPSHHTDKTKRYLIDITAIHNKEWIQASGKIYLYVNKNHAEEYHYGDQLMVNDSPKLLNEPQNPGEFNYKRFLTFNNIYHQLYSDGKNIRKTKSEQGNIFFTNIYKARSWAKGILSEHITSERELNIALALILGVKDGLTDEIKNAYSASGAMHVLAVSGLHVGIIYAIILLVFGRLQTNDYGKWYLAIITLVSLWAYAAITGLSPSVLRAVTMFSFVAVAKASSRTTNIYNTLAASAFVLLLYDPYLIMSVGFQLSYMAVLGIVYLQPKIYSLFIPNYYLIDKIWAITSVSIAAQLATFTLGLLYFHQFPTFFLLSNLVVIPGAFLILLGGLLLISVSAFAGLASIIGSLLSMLIYWINEIVFAIEALPNSLITDIYITTPQSWLLMISVVFIFLVFQYRKVSFLAISLACAIGFSLLQWNHVMANSSLEKITIYKVNNNTAIDWINNGKSTLITDSALWNNADKKRFHVAPNQLRAGVFSKNFVAMIEDHDSINAITIGGKNFLILDKPLDQFNLVNNLTTEYLIIAKGFEGDLQRVLKTIEFKMIVLDGSLPFYRANDLKKELEVERTNYYSVYHQGALNIKI